MDAASGEDGAFLMQIAAAAEDVKTWPQWMQDAARPLQAPQTVSRQRCHADCQQLRDGEPRATGRHCPLDTAD